MTPAQYKRALSELNLTQRNFAAFIGVHPDNGKRWAQRGPPPYVVKWLRYMLATKRSAAEINAILSSSKDGRAA